MATIRLVGVDEVCAMAGTISVAASGNAYRNRFFIAKILRLGEVREAIASGGPESRPARPGGRASYCSRSTSWLRLWFGRHSQQQPGGNCLMIDELVVAHDSFRLSWSHEGLRISPLASWYPGPHPGLHYKRCIRLQSDRPTFTKIQLLCSPMLNRPGRVS